MGFFDDDNNFDDIVRQFFGENGRRGYRREYAGNEDEERIIDFIEEGNEFFVIFEMPGYDKEDVNVEVNGRVMEIVAKKKGREEIKDYLAQKLALGIKYRKNLPDFVNPKEFSYSLVNGVLEIKFDRK